MDEIEPIPVVTWLFNTAKLLTHDEINIFTESPR